ncbi:MAG: helix-turn-helix domain-containing protein [Eubacterium sp.]
MEEKRYIISDASKMLNVESHVLRYWEEELAINIPRNEMGHRYYTENHINLLKNIRDLKKQGYGLRAIKMMITDPVDTKESKNLPEKASGTAVTMNTNDSKMEQFQAIMDKIVSKALKESTGDLSKELSENVSESVLKGMDYLMRVQDEKEEERYKKLDEVMRNRQRMSRRERKKKLKAEKMLTKKESRKKASLHLGKKPQTT